MTRSLLLLFFLSLLSTCFFLLPTPTTAALTASLTACQTLVENEGYNFTGGELVVNSLVEEGFCVTRYVNNIPGARGIAYLPTTDAILVVNKLNHTITWYKDVNENGRIDVEDETEARVIVQQDGINHGIAVYDTYLLASSDTTVYRWEFDESNLPTNGTLLTDPTIIVYDMPANGHHITRTLLVDRNTSFLYISAGSESNVDTNETALATRALIRRFNLTAIPNLVVNNDTTTNGTTDTPTGYSWSAGELFATGVRNEVGLALDKYGVVWGVENGADDLNRTDLGADIRNTNPGEEINKFNTSGLFYGYPYCWSEFDLGGLGGGPGTQWLWSDFLNDTIHSDAWCRDVANVEPPQAVVSAHSAPLGLSFYPFDRITDDAKFALPDSFQNRLFIPLHGSWNADTAVGYKLVTIPVEDDNTSITIARNATTEDFFRYSNLTADTAADWGIRPVDIAFGNNGEIYITSDSTGSIIVVRYVGVPTTNNTDSSSSSTGTVDSSTGVIDSSTGVIDSSTGVIDSSTGVIDSSTGVIDSSTGVIDSSTGVVDSSSTGPQGPPDGVDSSTGGPQGPPDSSSGGIIFPPDAGSATSPLALLHSTMQIFTLLCCCLGTLLWFTIV